MREPSCAHVLDLRPARVHRPVQSRQTRAVEGKPATPGLSPPARPPGRGSAPRRPPDLRGRCRRLRRWRSPGSGTESRSTAGHRPGRDGASAHERGRPEHPVARHDVRRVVRSEHGGPRHPAVQQRVEHAEQRRPRNLAVVRGGTGEDELVGPVRDRHGSRAAQPRADVAQGQPGPVGEVAVGRGPVPVEVAPARGSRARRRGRPRGAARASRGRARTRARRRRPVRAGTLRAATRRRGRAPAPGARSGRPRSRAPRAAAPSCAGRTPTARARPRRCRARPARATRPPARGGACSPSPSAAR